MMLAISDDLHGGKSRGLARRHQGCQGRRQNSHQCAKDEGHHRSSIEVQGKEGEGEGQEQPQGYPQQAAHYPQQEALGQEEQAGGGIFDPHGLEDAQLFGLLQDRDGQDAGYTLGSVKY